MESLTSRSGRTPRIIRWLAEHSARQSAIRTLYRTPGWRLRDLGIERGRIPEIVDGLLNRRRALAAENRRKPGADKATQGPLKGPWSPTRPSERPELPPA